MRKVLSIFIAFCLVFGLASCDNEKDPAKEAYLDAVRQVGKKYDCLYAGYACIQNNVYAFSYWNSASYDYAKKTAKLADALSAYFFPTTTWQGGTELLAQEKIVKLSYCGVSEITDTYQEFYVQYDINEGTRPMYTELYRMRYSPSHDYIYECELIYSTKRL